MIGTSTEKTEEFLQACKEAGYERVTIFVADKRVPDSVRIKKGSCTNGPGWYWGTGAPTGPFRVVCGAPEQRGVHATLKNVDGQPKMGWPKMWEIVHRLDLHNRGAGSGDGHDVLCPALLTAGYYDLSELAEVA